MQQTTWAELRENRLEARDSRGQLRRLCNADYADTPYLYSNDQRFINFSSNDYLGLSSDPRLISRSQEFAQAYGVGAGASRLLSGNHSYHYAVEEKLARLKGAEACLFFASGYQANSTLIPALVGRKHDIVMDRLCHQSLVQGAVSSRAQIRRFRHNDVNHLESTLQQCQGPTLIVTESVFSMDGDHAPLTEIITLAREYDSLLLVDEAHATGVLGKHGMGLMETYDENIFVTGTFSKGLGCYGAYLLSSVEWRDYLVNYCSGFVYSTAPPPPVLGAIDAALDAVPSMDAERSHIAKLGALFQKHLGIPVGHIVPILIGDEVGALGLESRLQCHGIIASAVRPPTVPEGAARLRVTLTAKHTEEQVEQLLCLLI